MLLNTIIVVDLDIKFLLNLLKKLYFTQISNKE